MRLRVSVKLLFLLAILLAAFTLVSYWSKCSSEFVPISQSRVERWRHLQSSVHLDPDAALSAKRKNGFFPTGDRIFRNEVSDDLADFDSADFADQSLAAPSAPSVITSFPKPSPYAPSWLPLDCVINDDYTVPCKRQGREVYLPFYGFLRKYFEVYGKLSSDGGKDRFEWQHSYSRVFLPKTKYDSAGSFLWFENYNVEVRDRVKCISAIEGVPVSTQWNPKGHIYPIQVAQFGLSHFSKNLTESKPPNVSLLDDGMTAQNGHWSTWGSGSNGGRSDKQDGGDNGAFMKRNEGAMEFVTDGPFSRVGISFNLDTNIIDTTLNFDVMFTNNGSVTAILEEGGKPSLYVIRYVTSDQLVDSTPKGGAIYGLGSNSINNWRRLTRDLKIDLQKGLSLLQSKKKTVKLRSLRLKSLIFRGEGRVTNLTLTSSAHMAHFYAASDWLVARQDSKGGWPIMVTRKLSNGILELSPGWYSAMAQGQAMSLLTRAFKVTGNLKYLETALAATKLFNIRSENHGVLTTFLGKYVWYEEYPTIPSSFVLNGFIYSLIGLYDLKMCCTTTANYACKEAAKLFLDGMISLKKMLTLFDTGSGSVYDLRHFSLGVAPNLARWDYHTTHINQLLLLATIDNDPILKTTADRWLGYMKGKKAPHN